jgi:hypothetical protein
VLKYLVQIEQRGAIVILKSRQPLSSKMDNFKKRLPIVGNLTATTLQLYYPRQTESGQSA